jgi:UPF0042 nucleotide-binding protein
MMKLVIISGRSGSGKSTALNILEDVGYYCIDNLPAGLLAHLVQQTRDNNSDEYRYIAVSIDARNSTTNFGTIPDLIKKLPTDVHTDIIYLDANSATLIKRFSETRRKHPLSNEKIALKQAIEAERKLLEPIAHAADLNINTSQMSVHELRDIIKKRVFRESTAPGMAILFMSFGYKRGIPIDADFVYDVRCLPNPYWIPTLRSLSGRDQGVIDFLSEQQDVNDMFNDICHYLDRWLPSFESNNRSYMTIAIGCTGGMHRSVYLSERLKRHYSSKCGNVQVHHRELG